MNAIHTGRAFVDIKLKPNTRSSHVYMPHYCMTIGCKGGAGCVRGMIWHCHSEYPEVQNLSLVELPQSGVEYGGCFNLQRATFSFFRSGERVPICKLVGLGEGMGCVVCQKSLQQAVTRRVGSRTIFKKYTMYE